MKKWVLIAVSGLMLSFAGTSQAMTMDSVIGKAKDTVTSSKFGGQVLGADSAYGKSMTAIKGAQSLKAQADKLLSADALKARATSQLSAWKSQATGALASYKSSMKSQIKSSLMSSIKGQLKSLLGFGG